MRLGRKCNEFSPFSNQPQALKNSDFLLNRIYLSKIAVLAARSAKYQLTIK